MKLIKVFPLITIILFSLYGVASSNDAFLDFEDALVGVVGECDGPPGNADTTCIYQSNGFTFMFLSDFYIDDGSIFPQINNNTQFFIPTFIPELIRGTPEVHPLIISFNPSDEISLDLYLINSLSPVRVEALDDKENILDFIETSIDGKVTFSGLSAPIHKLYLGIIGTTIGAGFAIDNIKTISNIDAILEFFDESVADGTIYGRGKKTWLANLRLKIMRWMLENADRLIEEGKEKKACKILERSYKRCDGEFRPRDFVIGESVSELADMIDEVMIALECERKSL